MAKLGDEVHVHPALGDGFDQPQEISAVKQAFPADLGDLIPKWEVIPDEFKPGTGGHTEWNKFISDWFFTGWPERGLFSRADVDPEKATIHLATILRSFEPKHEHKEAAVAWLTSRWFAAVGE